MGKRRCAAILTKHAHCLKSVMTISLSFKSSKCFLRPTRFERLKNSD